ncbi:hypothetical protein F5Y19DRAFT_102560 [Xylariaceae sp. FL1651]|nr:hypothetical protein F5Y19DRAFT_102560 [Xylariaceae sp. FL1651]
MGTPVVTSTHVSVGADISSTTQELALTTVFTPPSVCTTPFIDLDGCPTRTQICLGTYLPFLRLSASNSPEHTVQCVPELTTFYDGYVDGIYEYTPGLYCPGGMAIAYAVPGSVICCPSGLTLINDGLCKMTTTEGIGLFGPVTNNEVTVVSASAFSGYTVRIEAVPVTLDFPLYSQETLSISLYNSVTIPSVPPETPPSPLYTSITNSSVSSGEDNPPSTTDVSTTTTDPSDAGTTSSAVSQGSCFHKRGFRNVRRCQATSTASYGTVSASSSSTDNTNAGNPPSSLDSAAARAEANVGTGIGAAVAFTLLLGLIYFLAIRYRRRKLGLCRRLHLRSQSPDDSPIDEATPTEDPEKLSRKEEGGGGGVETHIRDFTLETDAATIRAELEGTPIEEGGPGIYVLKPELEGTAGMPGLIGVHVRKKVELEAAV